MASLGEELSDDEVFFGKMTLKEVKKDIWLYQGYGKTSNITSRKPVRDSIKIIETHSQPNLRSTSVDTPSPPASARDNRKSDESFIQMENLISKLCLSPEKAAELQLNNTLEIVEFILNNGPNQGNPNQQDSKNVKTEKEMQINNKNNTIKEEKFSGTPESKIILKKELAPTEISTPKIKFKTTVRERPETKIISKKEFGPAEFSTPKLKVKTTVKASPKYYTPAKSPKKQDDIFLTPSSNMLGAKTPIFKTPVNPLSLKKTSVSSLRNVPSKSPMYRHIKSPIATYIKSSIEVPLVTNVCPKKPLPRGSLIPKLMKKESLGKQNKENISLPTSSYKSAKKTKVVHVPDEVKPNSQVANKLLSTLPRPPVILKHDRREYNSAKKQLLQFEEDSIADQSCVQADLSVCTQVKPTKK